MKPDTPIDPNFPPSMTSFMVTSHGARLNAICYMANGAGPHPTAVLLHGYPGNERNLDLAQAMRRSGWNVIFFHYRGAWGSEGDFSVQHCVEDTHSVLDAIQTEDWQTNMRIDPTRVALVGHSMGGFVAITVGKQRDDVQYVASLAGANMVEIANAWGAVEDLEALKTDLSTGTALGGKNVYDLVTEIQAHPDDYNWVRNVDGLSGKNVLLVGGAQDRTVTNEAHLFALQAALRDVPNVELQVEVLDADHAFSTHRLALCDVVCGWLGK